MPVTALPARALCCPASKMAARVQARAKKPPGWVGTPMPPLPEQPRAWVQANARRAQTPAVLALDDVCVPQSVRSLESEIKMEVSLS